MKTIRKTVVTIIMLLAVLSAFLPGALAENAVTLETKPYKVQYAATSSALMVKELDFTLSATADYTVSDYQSFIRVIAEQYIKRDDSFTIRYNGTRSEMDANITNNNHLWEDIWSVDLSGTTSDLDYLRYNMQKSGFKWRWFDTYAFFEFSQAYLTTQDEEDYIDSAVDTIMGSLNLGASNPYEKIKAIHDYIISKVEYDETLIKHSAYDALHAGTTVCQGYALLTYKMMQEAGVRTRIIMRNDGGHVWNIVQIGPYWYNLDVTWDDAGTLDYFLKCNASFPDHDRDSKDNTVAFNAAQPMSPVNFDPSVDFLFYDPADLSSWAQEGVTTLIDRDVVPASIQSAFQDGIKRDEFTALIVAVYEYARGPYTLQNSSPFTDISGSIYATQIAKGYELGLINGISTDAFGPYGTLTREQCAKIISAAAGIINSSEIASEATLPFGDTASIRDWALLYVRYAYENELMNGTGANFEPQGLLTREQAMLTTERMVEKYGW